MQIGKVENDDPFESGRSFHYSDAESDASYQKPKNVPESIKGKNPAPQFLAVAINCPTEENQEQVIEHYAIPIIQRGDTNFDSVKDYESGILARGLSHASTIQNQYKTLDIPENLNLARKITRVIEEEPEIEALNVPNNFVLKELSSGQDYETSLYLLDLDSYDFYARRKVCKVLLAQKLYTLALRRVEDGIVLLTQVFPQN